MSASEKRGCLLIIGGAEDKERRRTILRKFVELAGGDEARIIVMTLATELPGEAGDEYRKVFTDLGAREVTPMNTSREEADSDETAGRIREATGIFFTGGGQRRIVETLKGTAVERALCDGYADGLVIGGTSAGASMMSDLMIIEGESETHPKNGIVELGEGMGLLESTVVDQHFAQRGRIGRLLYAVAQHEAHLGLGIDENTAILVRDDEFEVLGEGAVTIVDGSPVTYTNVRDLKGEENLALCGVRLHILPAGYRFDLQYRIPMTEASAS